MSQLLQFFIWLPFIGFILTVFLSRKNEKIISAISIGITGFYILAIIVFSLFWLFNSSPTLDIKHIVLFKSGNIEIFIDFFFDKISAVFALVGAIISFVVAVFSRTYLHRDEGFKRFFSIFLLFVMSYNLVVFAGNFETLFIGWEILGICSFLLIALYRDRYLPVRNSLKVITIYRVGDICLMLAMWMGHHLWHQNITFLQLQDPAIVGQHLLEHGNYAFFIALMLVIASAAKSAQLPFSAWLPRAMEGPTSSSALFYGSLSVHLGVFILLRTSPYWEGFLSIKIFIGLIGISTALIANGIARVQSTVKTQIAYASIAQIALIFIEIALGWNTLALIHFIGNSLLRSYQLLVSPSVLGYKIHDQFFSFLPSNQISQNSFLTKIRNSFYLLSIKEWNLDLLLQKFLWLPFKKAGILFNQMNTKVSTLFFGLLFLLGIFYKIQAIESQNRIFEYLPHLYSMIGFILILKAFAEKGDARIAWLSVLSGQLFITLSITLLNESFGVNHILLFLAGSSLSALIGFICLHYLNLKENNIHLNQFHGHSYEYPKLGFVFLLSCLGLVGLPFTPSFIGIDVLFSHIHKQDKLVIIFTTFSYMIVEIAVLRIYARLFLGQHSKSYHPIAYRSS
jgi:NADH-quinone oxidoreductase subunit L